MAQIFSAPFRVSRTTKSSHPAVLLSESGVMLEESAPSGEHCALRETGAEVGAGSATLVQSDSESVALENSGEESGGDRRAQDAPTVASAGPVGMMMTALLQLDFVAAPGHGAPEGQTVEYVFDLTKSHGSREVTVFLGEFDYNNP